MKVDKLDRAFSLYIRTRDSDENGYGKCCTCGKRLHITESHCGHFISRRHMATRFNEQNTAIQCPRCNTFNQGRQYEFSLYIEGKYGEDVPNRLLLLSRGVSKLGKFEIDEMTKYYKQKVKELQASKLA